ncbi:MAG: hypothetical protein ABI200_02770 [Gaiellales bacterium]
MKLPDRKQEYEMKVDPGTTLSFGVVSGTNAPGKVEITEVLYPGSSPILQHGVVSPSDTFAKSSMVTYELGDDGPRLIQDAFAKLAASGIEANEVQRFEGAGSGIAQVAAGEHLLYVTPMSGPMELQALITPGSSTALIEALTAVHALRDAGMEAGRASEGGAAGGVATL